MGGGFNEVYRVQARVDGKGWWLAWHGRGCTRVSDASGVTGGARVSAVQVGRKIRVLGRLG